MKSVDNNEDFIRWLSGIPYEVAFWRSYYGNRRRRADLFGWSLYNKPCTLDCFDIDSYIRECGNPSPRLLDVGCALSYAFGNIIDGKAADVRYVDPLAPFYNDILHRYRIDRPEITFGMIECLSATFPRDSVDFIHVRNALDHCADPMTGIIQCLLVVRQGGVVYLNHFINEAENENYRGFHQFNICAKDGHLHIWNPQTDIDVDDACRGFATVTTSTTDSGRVVAVIRKTCEIPDTLYNTEAMAHDLADKIMTTVGYFHTLRSSGSYQLRRLISTIGHRTMRLLPFSLLNRIKRLAGK